ncbi:hypothetical protein Syun_001773 [Stephania yunnanensis]|uniref:Uncharacterized protein n=1 Tax=Stephania yunnanensis TaxID=152371 RepID=A0AAP0LEE7_9MAGN
MKKEKFRVCKGVAAVGLLTMEIMESLEQRRNFLLKRLDRGQQSEIVMECLQEVGRMAVSHQLLMKSNVREDEGDMQAVRSSKKAIEIKILLSRVSNLMTHNLQPYGRASAPITMKEALTLTGDLDKMVALQRLLEPYGICELEQLPQQSERVVMDFLQALEQLAISPQHFQSTYANETTLNSMETRHRYVAGHVTKYAKSRRRVVDDHEIKIIDKPKDKVIENPKIKHEAEISTLKKAISYSEVVTAKLHSGSYKLNTMLQIGQSSQVEHGLGYTEGSTNAHTVLFKNTAINEIQSNKPQVDTTKAKKIMPRKVAASVKKKRRLQNNFDKNPNRIRI